MAMEMRPDRGRITGFIANVVNAVRGTKDVDLSELEIVHNTPLCFPQGIRVRVPQGKQLDLAGGAEVFETILQHAEALLLPEGVEPGIHIPAREDGVTTLHTRNAIATWCASEFAKGHGAKVRVLATSEDGFSVNGRRGRHVRLDGKRGRLQFAIARKT